MTDMERRHYELVKLVRERARGYFRTAVRYTDDDWHVIYRRQDLPDERSKRRSGRIIAKIREREPLRELDSPFGEFESVVELYENGVFIVIRESETAGVVLSLERGAAESLASFVVECERVVAPTDD
ncbi:hypothetical protein [Halarchaeum nitratireducens]|uniref:Uncharacterized protein n=1 Tax=Halarchaeum nitratireducens TaxID=489913 RepID=A0A830GF13_9EURY|nr:MULTISPECIES: hypothetical protein [Halarchaeum]MBP2251677.1 hypothetical protein [Halarchaeum solikamskense]GGN23165.1 hypothetical protein GCM10009021_25940 [Halarchaeum nitratireducens]